MREPDSNRRHLGHEPSVLPTALPRDIEGHPSSAALCPLLSSYIIAGPGRQTLFFQTPMVRRSPATGGPQARLSVNPESGQKWKRWEKSKHKRFMYSPREKRKDSRPSSAACCPMLSSGIAAGPGLPKLVYQMPILGIRLQQAAHRGGSASTSLAGYYESERINHR